MNVRDIRGHIRRQPFVPFRVHVSDGTAYDVFHPDFILLTLTDVMIGLDAGSEDIPERKVFIDPLHITRIEPISNGRRTNHRKRKS